MTVSTVVDHNDYTGNGVTTSFPYTFRIFKKEDLSVSVVDLDDNITVLVLDTDYAVTNAGGYNGGNVVLTTPLANGWKISIARELEPTQETDLRNQGKFFAEVHEDALDKLTMLIQQVYSVFRLALRKPSSVANWYDAMNNYIRNLRDPKDPQDAATKSYADSLSAGNTSHTDLLFSRTLRTAESIPQLPSVEFRKNKIVGMDNDGNPIMLLPESGSASDVLIELAKPTGAGLIGFGPGKYVADLMVADDDKGDALIGVKQPFNDTVNRTQHDKNAETLSIRDFYNPDDTDWTNAFKKAARVSADIGKQIFVPAGIYLVSDSIPLYDNGHNPPPSPDVLSYYKGNGTQFVGEGRKTVIRKTAASTKDVNAVFYVSDGAKRGMRVSDMSIIDLTDNAVGVYSPGAVVCTHFENLFIMARRVGLWLTSAFVDVSIIGVICQGHDDEATYPMQYGFRIGSGSGTSVVIDRCHAGSIAIDGYNIYGNYSNVGVLSCDKCKGVPYVFDNFRGEISTLGFENTDSTVSNGNVVTFNNGCYANIGHISVINVTQPSGVPFVSINGGVANIGSIQISDASVLNGRFARLRGASSMNVTYVTPYKYAQFALPSDYDSSSNTFLSVGSSAGMQQRFSNDFALYGSFALPNADQTSGNVNYRIFGWMNNKVGCLGTITSSTGGYAQSVKTMIMDIDCTSTDTNQNAKIVKKAISSQKNDYTAWYTGIVDGRRYLMVKMDDFGSRNLGTYFQGLVYGNDPNLFRVVSPSSITDLATYPSGIIQTESAT